MSREGDARDGVGTGGAMGGTMTALLALLLVAPDGTTTEMHAARACWWVDLGPSHRPHAPDAFVAQGWGYWSVFVQGPAVELTATDEHGWWQGAWFDPGIFRLMPQPETGNRWRRVGMTLESWSHGHMQVCVTAPHGEPALWGAQVEEFGSFTARNFLRARDLASAAWAK